MLIKCSSEARCFKDNKLLLLVMALLINNLFGSILKKIIAGAINMKAWLLYCIVINTVLVILYEVLKPPCVPNCI